MGRKGEREWTEGRKRHSLSYSWADRFMSYGGRESKGVGKEGKGMGRERRREGRALTFVLLLPRVILASEERLMVLS